MTSIEVLVIGGVAAGASFAARARRLDEQAHVTVIERGPDVSFANCGLPYHIGGEISSRRNLVVQTKQTLKALLNLDVRTLCEAVQIDRVGKRVEVKNVQSGKSEWLPYDKLMLAPGAAPIVPPLDGADDPRILTLRSLQDADRLVKAVETAKRAVVVGAGFIGLEMAEQLRRKGLEVALVELQPQVLPQVDAKITLLLEDELRRNGIELLLGEQVTGFDHRGEAIGVRLASGKRLDGDFVIMSVGVRPDTGLARDAGLALGARGHIVVDEFMRTSDPNIYAAGDAVETKDRVMGGAVSIPLGGPANRQGRVAADHVFLGAKARPYPGSLGTAIVRSFDVAVGVTGWTEQRLQKASIPYGSVTVGGHHHAGYYPGAKVLSVKICWADGDGRLLGAQVTGHDGVDKRVDVLATAIEAKMTVEDLCHLELAYAPPFGSAKDVINLAGFAATNLRDGLVKNVHALPDEPTVQLLDVRDEVLAESAPVVGAINIPLPHLRGNLDELDPGRPVVTVCSVGKLSYFAARMLEQNGFEVASLSGGLKSNVDPEA